METLYKKVIILGENKIKFLEGQMKRLPSNHSFPSKLVEKVELECTIFSQIDYTDRYLENYLMGSDLVIFCLPKEKENFYKLWRYTIPRISPYYKSTIKDMKEKDVVDFRESFMGIQKEKEKREREEKIIIFVYGEDEEIPDYSEVLEYIYPRKLTYFEKDKERFMEELALFMEENSFN